MLRWQRVSSSFVVGLVFLSFGVIALRLEEKHGEGREARPIVVFSMFDKGGSEQFQCWASAFLRATEMPLAVTYLDDVAGHQVQTWAEANRDRLAARGGIFSYSGPGQKGIKAIAAAPAKEAVASGSSLLEMGVAWPSGEYERTFPKEVLRMLEEGKDVLHSDVDAVWNQDPTPFLAAYPDADLVGSMDWNMPLEVEKLWGFILNTGFLLVRSTPGSKALMKDIQVGSKLSFLDRIGGNEQMLLNRRLALKGCSWKRVDGGPVEREQLRHTDSDVVGQCGDLKVVALSYERFTRRDDFKSGAKPTAGTLQRRVVMHPNWEGSDLDSANAKQWKQDRVCAVADVAGRRGGEMSEE